MTVPPVKFQAPPDRQAAESRIEFLRGQVAIALIKIGYDPRDAFEAADELGMDPERLQAALTYLSN